MDTPLGSVLYITLGCARNEVDTDRMRDVYKRQALQNALGKPIAMVVLLGLAVVGFVIIGFSVGGVLRSARDRAADFAEQMCIRDRSRSASSPTTTRWQLPFAMPTSSPVSARSRL